MTKDDDSPLTAATPVPEPVLSGEASDAQKAQDGGGSARSTSEEARAAVSAILKIAGIEQVISIDDVNDTGARSEANVEAVVGALRLGALSVEAVAEIDDLRSLVVAKETEGATELVTTEELIDILTSGQEVSTQQLELLSRATNAVSEGLAVSDEAATQTMNSDIHRMSELDELFEPDVLQRVTLSQWEEQSGGLLEDLTPKLLLFDRDFSAEGRGDRAGERAIADVINKQLDHIYCAMLTHSAQTEDTQRAVAEAVARDEEIALVQVVVVAKARLHDEPDHFALLLKTALLVRYLVQLRDGVMKALESGVAAAGVSLQALDSWTLLGLVQTAVAEGVHDADNLVRLASTAIRRAVRREITAAEFMTGPVATVRAAAAAAPAGSTLRPSTHAARYLHEDRFDSNEYLSLVHAPIEPGDIFETVDPRKLLDGAADHPRKTLILLAQHCDLMVRSNGRRSFEPQLFVSAQISAIDHEGRPSDVELEWFKPGRADGRRYVVRLGDPIHLLRRAVDACAMSADGSAVMSMTSDSPTAFTVGWMHRFDRSQEWLRKTIKKFQDFDTEGLSSKSRHHVMNSLLGVAKDVHEVDGLIDLRKQKIAYGLRRVGRLTDNDTRVLLAQANDHAGRPAGEGPLLPVNEVRLEEAAGPQLAESSAESLPLSPNSTPGSAPS